MPDFENLRLFTLTVTYPEAAFSRSAWCNECEEHVVVEEDGSMVHPDGDVPVGHDDYYRELNPNWEPEGWLVDPDARDAWVERFGNEEFFWPKANRVYFTRGTARLRARLLEAYGAKVEILESEPVVWLTPERIQEKRIAELEAELASLRSVS